MFSEKEIQTYIWDNRENWASLIDDLDKPELYTFNADLSDLKPELLLFNRVISRITEIDAYIRNVELFGCEVPLMKEAESTIRVDLLGSSPGSPGISIIEIKKSGQTEREAFTELLGYSNHINSIFPTHSREDYCYVLIAPFKTRIIREAFIHTLIFDNKPAYILVPYFADEAILESLRLRPWTPQLKDVVYVTQSAFAGRNFSVAKVVWQEDTEQWNPEPGENPKEWMKHQMNQVSAFAAQIMEAEGIHGFVYASQSWSELKFPFPNALVLVGLNPYAIANDNIQLYEFNVSKDELVPCQENLFNMTAFLPGLKKSAKDLHDNFDYFYDLFATWESHLFRIGLKVANAANKYTDGRHVMTDQGFMNWEQHQKEFFEDIACHNYDIRPTGLLRELFWDVTRIDYNIFASRDIDDHPVLGDIFRCSVETLNSQNLFREFVARMFGDVEL